MRIFFIVIFVSVWIMLAMDLLTIHSILQAKKEIQILEDRLSAVENIDNRSDL